MATVTRHKLHEPDDGKEEEGVEGVLQEQDHNALEGWLNTHKPV